LTDRTRPRRKSWSAVVEPQHGDRRTVSSRRPAVREAAPPLQRPGAKRQAHDSVVPTTLVVQFVDDAVNDADVDRRRCDGGDVGCDRLRGERLGVGGWWSVDADPNPPRTPAGYWSSCPAR